MNATGCRFCGATDDEADWSFSRVLCACDAMHNYCQGCGMPDGCPLDADWQGGEG